VASRREINEYGDATRELSAMARRDLDQVFAALDVSRPELTRDLLLEILPALVAEYGDLAAALAAEWYESVAPGRALVAGAVAPVRVVEAVRFHAGGLWTPNAGDVAGALAVKLDQYIREPGRRTIERSSARNDVAWARVPSGRETCAFCLVLASRDAAYLTREAALKSKRTGETYHGFCDCEAVPITSDDDRPDGYDPDDLYDLYSASRDAAGSGDIRDITAAMRREFPDRVRDSITV
jgi:hypothetical protein